MSVSDGIAAIGQLDFDIYCGQPDYPTKGGGYDYVEIPDGSCAPPSPGTVTSDRYCGTDLNCAQTISPAIAGTPANTVCTNNMPFKIMVSTDGYEGLSGSSSTSEGSSLSNSRGFRLRCECITRP